MLTINIMIILCYCIFTFFNYLFTFVLVGENGIFECEIEGATKVTWLKNNMPLPSSITHRTSITEDKENNLYKLQINKVILSDSGTYTVKAENDIGESTSTALLFVENRKLLSIFNDYKNYKYTFNIFILSFSR